MDPGIIEYIFRFAPEHFPDGVAPAPRSVTLRVAPDVGARAPDTAPAWCKLEQYQCPHCPLDTTRHSWCPVAMQLLPLVAICDGMDSHQPVEVEARSERRRCVSTTTMQRGMSALVGLAVGLSGCPYTEYFRPMAFFHLPFADEGETIYRAASMYLLAQYYRKDAGLVPDPGLDGLRDIYKDMQTLNVAIARRLRAGVSGDATVNAVVLLDLLAKVLPESIEDSLNEIRAPFNAYLR